MDQPNKNFWPLFGESRYFERRYFKSRLYIFWYGFNIQKALAFESTENYISSYSGTNDPKISANTSA